MSNLSLRSSFRSLYRSLTGPLRVTTYKKRYLRPTKIYELVPTENISLKQLFLGNKINICSRQLEIVDYGDDYTQAQLASSTETTLALIKPDAINQAGKIISKIYNSGLSISQAKMVKLTSSQAGEFYAEHKGKSFFQGLVDHMTSGSIIALTLVGRNAVSQWRECLGPTDPEMATELDKASPTDIRILSTVAGECQSRSLSVLTCLIASRRA